MIVIAAALAMAACDSSDPGLEPGPITTTDTSDTGKGDDPYQPDTYTAVPDTATNDTFTPPLTAEELCGELLELQGIWWCESENNLIDGDRLDVTVEISTAGDQCEVTFACDGCGTWSMAGKILPLTAEYKNGIYDWTTDIFIEGGVLIREDVRTDRPDAPIRIEYYR
ncbi:MAG: hypothetical protein KBD29_01210 [Candidatus Magasanikbacteria bacterium]|nr:hypothetical protein [Candidatus Magasanikbacteria bacterium]